MRLLLPDLRRRADPDERRAADPAGCGGQAVFAAGRRLFINVQCPGLTCVITGPWHRL